MLLDEVTDEERDEADEKNRLISQVLELQNTLDGKITSQVVTFFYFTVVGEWIVLFFPTFL